MYQGKTVLQQMQSLISGYDFKKIVFEHHGDKGIRVLSTRNLLDIMVYVHVASKQSLRDIVLSLQSKTNLWYHLGLKSVSRNNLAHAMKNRSAQIFEKTFYLLLEKLQQQRGFIKDRRFKFKVPIKSIDSTTISLCLSLFDWAQFRQTKGGIKLHVMYDNRSKTPDFVNITEASTHDVAIADSFPISPGSVYVMDKGYMHFALFRKIAEKGAFFVTRTKTNTQYRIIERRTKKSTAVKADWIVEFSSYRSKEYSERLRVVHYRDPETGAIYKFLTNNLKLSAQAIADIYKSRWDIELFFRWIKQNLKVKTFIGTSENAVLLQIWTAMIAYLLTEYIRFISSSCHSLLTVFRLLSENILSTVSIEQILNGKPPDRKKKINCDELQLVWNF